VFKIAIVITSLLGHPLEVFDWPRPAQAAAGAQWEFKTLADCQAELSKDATMQTMAKFGSDYAAVTGEANFTRGLCYE
jgi:hypothetical protein